MPTRPWSEPSSITGWIPNKIREDSSPTSSFSPLPASLSPSINGEGESQVLLAPTLKCGPCYICTWCTTHKGHVGDDNVTVC